MNDQQLDDRLKAWFAPLAAVAAPPTLRATVDAIPDRFPVRRGWPAALRSRPILLIATIGLLLALAVGVAFVIGSRPPTPLPTRTGVELPHSSELSLASTTPVSS